MIRLGNVLAEGISPRSVRECILDDATRIVTKDRNATHGEPEDAFGLIAASWSAKLGIAVTPAQVCILLADLKACRAWLNPAHADNWIDLAGYAACGAETAGIVYVNEFGKSVGK